MSLFLFLLVSGVCCGLCLWLLLDLPVYLFGLAYTPLNTHEHILHRFPEEYFVCIEISADFWWSQQPIVYANFLVSLFFFFFIEGYFRKTRLQLYCQVDFI